MYFPSADNRDCVSLECSVARGVLPRVSLRGVAYLEWGGLYGATMTLEFAVPSIRPTSAIVTRAQMIRTQRQGPPSAERARIGVSHAWRIFGVRAGGKALN